MLPLTVKFKLLRRPPWCDQIPTPAENQLCPYSEHTCAHRHSHGSGKLFGESNHRKPGVVMSIIPLEFRGANSGGPPDLRGRRQNPRPKRASMKSRVNNSARPPSQKKNPPAQAPHALSEPTRGPGPIRCGLPSLIGPRLNCRMNLTRRRAKDTLWMLTRCGDNRRNSWNALPHELTALSFESSS